ncbi:hypothetical protein PG994_000048 [Apiospora phragmitis]|uniref:PRA1 family protein n=1 Tax=Apiospora phragmitis TaxID=2905665 RepID=A0ABR1X561_9PEZI
MLLVSKVSIEDIEELAKKQRKSEDPDKAEGFPALWRLVVCTSSLLCKWRRIGTKWQIPRLPRFSPDGSIPSRAKSFCSVAPPPDPDLVTFHNQRFFSRLDDISVDEAIFRIVSTAVFFINVALMATMWYYLVCIVSVVLGLVGPADSPPFYGSLRNAYTLRGLWRYSSHETPPLKAS